MTIFAKASYPLLSLIRPTRSRLLNISQSRQASALSLNPLKWFKRNPKSQPPPETTVEVVATQTQSEVDSYEDDVLRNIDDHTNKFIPVTRGTLLKTLVMEKNMFTAKERQSMEDLAAALDSYYSHKFYGILEESKVICSATPTNMSKHIIIILIDGLHIFT